MLKKYEFFKTNNGVLYCGDCKNILPLLKKEIDFVIADFPYNVSVYKNRLTRIKGQIKCADFGDWDKWDNYDDYISWIFDIHKLILNICKNDISLLYFFSNNISGWLGVEFELKNLSVLKQILIWVKNNPIPQIRKTSFRSSYESSLWLINNKSDNLKDYNIVIKPKTFNFLEQSEMKNVWEYNIGKKDTEHPTEKPLSLIERAIKIFSNKNDIVLDPFSGSGTTALACEKLERKWVGIEINEKYCEMAKKRIENYTKQVKLF